ncbi:zinc-dependent metalloprotease family protein [Halolamina pelagica]|uniref:zinc-dependent metalloprotease family protein n=1 Tax=Halolamina pelagica TaxID=699431 RepID=UPI00373FCE55
MSYCSGYDESTVGCAPVYEYVGAADDDKTEIEIEDGYTNESTITTIEHELGHTLGLDHDDADRLELMNATSVINETSITDATEREWPWKQTNFTVYVKAGGV